MLKKANNDIHDMIVTNLLTIFAAMMRSERHNEPMKWRDFAAQSKHYIIVKIMDNCSRLCVILSQFGSNIKTNGVVKGLYFPVWNYCLFGCSSLWKHDSSFRQFEGIEMLPFPLRNIMNPPCEALDGRLACVVSEYATTVKMA